MKRLHGVDTALANFFASGPLALQAKLGPILWQFAATKRFEPDDFAAFLQLLPSSRNGVPLRHAVEVRHQSFDDPAFVDLVCSRNVAVVRLDPAPLLPVTSGGFVYARLQGMREDVPTGYEDAALDGWAGTARGWADEGDVFLFAINGAKVRAPAAAEALIARFR